MDGGFVGVDVFFVVAGFLLFRPVLAIVSGQRRMSIVGSIARLALWVLPSAGVVLLATGLAANQLLPPIRQLDLYRDVIAAGLGVLNWDFAVHGSGFGGARTPSPLLPFWSLSVAAQLVVVAAPAVWGLRFLVQRLRLNPLLVLLSAVSVSVAASFAFSVYWVSHDAAVGFFATPSVVWEFGVGAAAAAGMSLMARVPELVRGVLCGAGLLGLGYAVVAFTSATAYPGVAALLPVLATAVILVSGSGAVGVSSPRVSRLVGRIIVSWYLWHAPVLVIAEAAYGPFGWPARLGLVLATGVLAVIGELLMRWRPRFVHRLREPRDALAFAATAMMLPIMLGLVLGTPIKRAELRDAQPGAPTLATPDVIGHR